MSRDQHTAQSAWRDDNEAEALIDAIEGTEQSGNDPEYRVRLMVELVLLPDQRKGASNAKSHAHAAAWDACAVKSFFEDEDLQRRIDEGGYRGRIIGASVEDVRCVGFGVPLDVDELLKDWRADD